MSPEDRQPLLLDLDANDFQLKCNSIYLSFELIFKKTCRKYDGIPTKDQEEWYVSDRWDPENNQKANFVKPPEKELVEFLCDPDDTSQGRVLLIEGRTGGGKTTFINHFMNTYIQHELPDLFQNAVILRTDCGDVAYVERMDDAEKKILERINRELNEKAAWLDNSPHYVEMWREELNLGSDYSKAIINTCPGDTGEEKIALFIKEKREQNIYLFNVIRLKYLINKCHRTVVLILDNIDQATTVCQLDAVRLARLMLGEIPNLKIIIAVREYLKKWAKSELQISAFGVQELKLYPPNIYEVLRQRARAAFRDLKQKSESVNVDIDNPDIGKLSVRIVDGIKFLESVLYSFKMGENRRILTRSSDYNLRDQLEMVHKVLRSGHIAPDVSVLEAVRKYYVSPQKPWIIRWADLLESLICGDYHFAVEQRPVIHNIFTSQDTSTFSEGFQDTLIAAYILKIIDISGEIGKSDLERKLNMLGFATDLVNAALGNLASNGLILADKRPDFVDPEGLLQFTIKGRYYIRELIRKLMYVQHMGIVTPLEEKFRDEVRQWNPQEFDWRIKGALALAGQLCKDERDQRARIKGGGEYAEKIMSDFSLGHISNWIVKKIIKELKALRDSREGSRRQSDLGGNINKIMSKFEQLLKQYS